MANLSVEISSIFTRAKSKAVGLLFAKSPLSSKREINWKPIKYFALAGATLFLLVVLILPTEQETTFTRRIETPSVSENTAPSRASGRVAAVDLWASPQETREKVSSQVNYDTPMVLNEPLGNANTQLRKGRRLPVRILDTAIVSETPVPVLAEVLQDTASVSGVKIPAGSKLYGEMSFEKGQSRAQIKFTQLSYPDGRIQAVAASAISKDGQIGVEGDIKSDANKNSAGSVITSFVAGLASGSVETDAFGGSRGGLTNGLLSAVGGAAKERAQQYGERLKNEREWIEVKSATEFDVILNETFEFQSHESSR